MWPVPGYSSQISGDVMLVKFSGSRPMDAALESGKPGEANLQLSPLSPLSPCLVFGPMKQLPVLCHDGRAVF